MDENKLAELTVSQITTFLSVSKTLSMSRSAQELFVGQSTVSKRIGEIEKITDITLFSRENNSLALTAAGNVLAKQLSDIYDRLCSGLYEANAVQNGYSDNFNLSIDTTLEIKIIYDTIEVFRKRYPNLNINIETDVYTQKQKVLNNEIDLAMAYKEPYGQNEIKLEYKTIETMPLYAIVNRNSPLAQKEKIELLDLVGERIIVPAAQTRDGYVNNLQYYFRDINSMPNIFGTVHSCRFEYQALFDKGFVITTLASVKENSNNTFEFFEEKLKFFRLENCDIVSAFCWKKGTQSPYIEEFTQIYTQKYKETQQSISE